MFRFSLFIPLILILGACANGPPPMSENLASRVVVYKTERELVMYDANGQPFGSYKIAMGENPVGPKQCEGDGRTPEGTYYIEQHNPDSHYHLSLKISYPNPQDVANAKSMGLSPGGDIFIHGVPNNASLWRQANMYIRNPDWTNGCIAVNNHDIEQIWSHVADGTPIEIRP